MSRAISLPGSYRVRDVLVEPNVVLAPMEGVTDRHFRLLIREIGGIGLSCTEFIASEGLKRGSGKQLELADFDSEERPIPVQIYGKRPEVMALAAEIVTDLGATIIDINMGCPSKKVCAHSGGSALMKDPGLATEIVRAVRSATPLPLTVKMRSGFDAEHRNAPEIAWICQEEGAEAVTIHWRTRADLYGGTRQVDKIAEAKSRLSIPVIGNGDIVDVDSALSMMRETGVDGVMVGRGAMRDPWCCLQIARALQGKDSIPVNGAMRHRVLLRYLAAIETRFHSEKGTLGRFKKIANHFTQGLPHAEGLRVRVLRSQSLLQARDELDSYFERLALHERGESVQWPGVPGPVDRSSQQNLERS
jgi:nifR3 family TIM-barrel protein